MNATDHGDLLDSARRSVMDAPGIKVSASPKGKFVIFGHPGEAADWTRGAACEDKTQDRSRLGRSAFFSPSPFFISIYSFLTFLLGVERAKRSLAELYRKREK